MGKEKPSTPHANLPEDVFSKIHEAIGAASMCWNPAPSKEVFDANQASEIAFELCRFIADRYEKPA